VEGVSEGAARRRDATIATAQARPGVRLETCEVKLPSSRLAHVMRTPSLRICGDPLQHGIVAWRCLNHGPVLLDQRSRGLGADLWIPQIAVGRVADEREPLRKGSMA
jgi:hypothetical protein